MLYRRCPPGSNHCIKLFPGPEVRACAGTPFSDKLSSLPYGWLFLVTLRLLQCRLIGLTSPTLVLLCLCFLVSLAWYLAFSGRRLVQDCQCLSA